MIDNYIDYKIVFTLNTQNIFQNSDLLYLAHKRIWITVHSIYFV